MENIEAETEMRNGNDGACTCSSSSPSSYKLFGRQVTIHQFMGGGTAADILLWKQRHVSFGVIIIATAAWMVLEHSGLPFLTICSDVLLTLIILLFLNANYAAYKDKPLHALPRLVLSEEMVNNAATSFRVKFNYALLMAHDITVGKDFRLFFKVVVLLWIFSAIGNYLSFITLAYIGTILSITIPALYGKFENQIDRYCGKIHQQFSRHYKVVDENVISRIPQTLPKEKDT